MIRRASNAMIWAAFLSAITVVVTLQADLDGGERRASHSRHVAGHGDDCLVCRHSGRSLPDEIDADNVQSVLPAELTSE